MKSHKKKIERVALIEVDGSHDECLLFQIYALKHKKVTITLICTQAILDRNRDFDSLVDNLVVIDNQMSHNKVVRNILATLKTLNIQLAIFNTAQGAKVRDISVKLFFLRIRLVGIIHSTKKFEDSFRQKVININLKKYFLLSEFLYNKAKPPRGISISYFYPIRFPEFKTEGTKSETLTISIIGGVENKKKDLDGFIKMVEATDSDAIQFVFLGKSDPNSADVQKLKSDLKKINLIERVTFYDSFVSQEEFDRQLKQTDALLLLAHPNTSLANQYYDTQISGASNVAFGYNIPMLIHKEFEKVGELKHRSLFYDLENFPAVISNCKKELESIEEWMKNDQEMTFDFQEKKYLDFLFN